MADDWTDAGELPAFVTRAEKVGEICGRLRGEGWEKYTREPPPHFGPKRKDAWLRGYDAGLEEARKYA